MSLRFDSTSGLNSELLMAANATVYTDETMGSVTSQKYLENVADPSFGDFTIFEALTDHYVYINSETSKVITQYHKTGDVHITSYDFTTVEQIYARSGKKANKDGQYGPWRRHKLLLEGLQQRQYWLQSECSRHFG
eukprot:gene31135-38478_t